MPAPKRFPGVFPGTIGGSVDLIALFEQAEVVCRGEVKDVLTNSAADYQVQSGALWFEECVASVSPRTFYKGVDPASEVRVHFLRPPSPSSMADFAAGEHALLFLRWQDCQLVLADYTTAKVGLLRGEVESSARLDHPLASLLIDLESRLSASNAPILIGAIERLAERANGDAVAVLQGLADSGGALLREPARRALEALAR